MISYENGLWTSNFLQGLRADANTSRPRSTSIATSSHWAKSETANRPDIKCDSHSMHKRREMHTFCCRARPHQIWPQKMCTNSVSTNPSFRTVRFFFSSFFIHVQLLVDGWILEWSFDAWKVIKICNMFSWNRFSRPRCQRSSSSKWPIVSGSKLNQGQRY